MYFKLIASKSRLNSLFGVCFSSLRNFAKANFPEKFAPANCQLQILFVCGDYVTSRCAWCGIFSG